MSLHVFHTDWDKSKLPQQINSDDEVGEAGETDLSDEIESIEEVELIEEVDNDSAIAELIEEVNNDSAIVLAKKVDPKPLFASKTKDELAAMSKLDRAEYQAEKLRYEARQAQLKFKEFKAQVDKENRKLDTRRSILDGKLLAHLVKIGELNQVDLDRYRDNYLSEPRDRKLFGLSSR